MAISVPNVVKVTGSGVTSVTTSGVTTTTGSTFVAWTTADDGVTINAPSDSKSNSYGTAKVTVSTGGSTSKQTVYVKENGTGGASHTLTFTYGSATYPTAFFIECAGAATASYDSGSLTSGASGAGSPFNRNSGGQAQANNAILTFIATDAGGTLTYANSGYTVSQEQDGNNYWTGAIGRQIVSQTSAVTSSWTVSASNGGTVTFAIKEAAGGGGVTGTVSWTEANDTAALTGSATVSGAPSWTEANDTATVAGSVTVSGSASWTEANDTAALTGSVIVSGAPSWTEANDSAALTGTLTVSGVPSWTESADAWSITGQVDQPASGTIAWAEVDDLWSLSGTSDVVGNPAVSYAVQPRKRKKPKEKWSGIPFTRMFPDIEPAQIEVIERAAEEAAQQPEPPSKSRAISFLSEYGIYQERLARVLIEIEQIKREEREEDEIAAVIAACL